MEKEYSKRTTTVMIIALLLVLSFFILKPILLSIVIALILALFFYPIYIKINKLIKSKNISAFLICVLLAAIIIVPIWFLTPILINQAIQFYMAIQQIDFMTPLKKIFPSLFASETFSKQAGSAIYTFISKATSSIMDVFADFIRNFPKLCLQLTIVMFTFFFALRDQDKLLDYVKSLLPFSKDVEKKLFDSSREITFSVIYGQIILGIVQGLLCGVAFFIFKVPNPLFLTILACIAGIFPAIATAIIWIPTAIYLFVAGNIFPAFGIIIFGLASGFVENFVKPIIISKRTKLHSAIVLVGMIGGLFFFGLIGLILGPLILAYLFIVLEIYRDKKIPGIIIQPPESQSKK